MPGAYTLRVYTLRVVTYDFPFTLRFLRIFLKLSAKTLVNSEIPLSIMIFVRVYRKVYAPGTVLLLRVDIVRLRSANFTTTDTK